MIQLWDSKAAASFPVSHGDLREEQLRRHPGWGTSKLCECFAVLQDWRSKGIQGDRIYEELEVDVWLGICGVETKLSADTQRYPTLTRFINQFIRENAPELRWTSVRLTRNPQTFWGFDGCEDSGHAVWTVSLGESLGGGLWVEGVEGDGPVVRQASGRDLLAGHVVDIRGRPVEFAGSLRHSLEPWIGETCGW